MTQGYIQQEPGVRKKGRIVRVKMTNFVTYENAECFPGKALNVVIGPNGSGKSTLLSAIVLGLGGKPSVLGRSPLVQDYIKSGCQDAKIEIELEGEKKNYVIKRTILRDGRSTWQHNGCSIAFKDVEKLTKSLNIQIDNLCQVLPQDRVQDFAKLNAQQLLDSTQKAVGKEGLSAIHTTLKELQKKQKTVEGQISHAKTKLEHEQAHVDRLDSVVKKHQMKKDILLEVETCKQKEEIIKYHAKREETLRFREQKEVVLQEIQKISKKIEPHKQLITAADHKVTELQNDCAMFERRVQLSIKDLDGKEKCVEGQVHKIIEEEVAKDNKLKQATKQREDIEKLRLKISRMRTNLASLIQIPEAQQKQEVATLRMAIDELARKLSELNRQKMQIEANLGQERQALEEVTQKLSTLENVKVTRLRTLQQHSKDAYRAAMWIDQNRNRFVGNVFLPLCVELNVTDPEFARYVEASIGFNDLVAFACESKTDFSTIVNELRVNQRLAINVLHAESIEDTFRPSMDINTLNQRCPGFFGYLKDFVSGPPTLISWLCKQKNFHLIPVGSENVNNDKVPNGISLYYTGEFKRSVNISRYTGDPVRTCDSIGPARFLVNATDPQEIEGLKQRAQNLTNVINVATEKRASVNSQIKDLEVERNNKRNELGKIQTAQSTYDTGKFQLAQKERDLRNAESNLIDPRKIEDDFTIAVKAYVDQLIGLQEPYLNCLKTLEKYVQEGQVSQIAVSAAEAYAKACKRTCKKEQDALDQAKRQLEEVNNACADCKTEAKKLLNNFERKNNIKMEVFLAQQEKALTTLPSTIDELESYIQDKLARADMLGGNNDTDVLQEYEDHVHQVSDLESTIRRKEAESERITAEMTCKQNEWKEELSSLVSNINSNFSRYFESMRCAGEVELFTGNSEHDYDNYGLKVRVKFRETDNLQDLNAYTQSGGERAVTTAIYMLSLQELTPVPFRLVDEINQGMDAINERRVFELLLTSTSQPGTAQYFLLTPKLLRNMPYSNCTTVLCIMNSACAPDYRFWDLRKFIQLQKSQNGNGSHDVQEDEED